MSLVFSLSFVLAMTAFVFIGIQSIAVVAILTNLTIGMIQLVSMKKYP